MTPDQLLEEAVTTPFVALLAHAGSPIRVPAAWFWLRARRSEN